MTKKAIISKADGLRARFGYKWDAQIITDGYYAGYGRYCYTLEEAKQYAADEGAESIEIVED